MSVDQDDDDSEYHPIHPENVSQNKRKKFPRRCKNTSNNNKKKKTQKQIITDWIVCFFTNFSLQTHIKF